MKIAVSVESTHDLSKELLEKFDIKVIPYQITLGDMTFKDGEYSTEEMFAFVDKYKKLPKTTALNEFEYGEFFEGLKKDYDAVIHICLSSGITSSCGNAERAAAGLENVFAVDRKSLSTGIGLLAICARELADKGLSPERIVEILNERKEKNQTSFVIERLDYLYKGGRCNSIQLLGANILRIRPSVILKGGKMVMHKRYRGNMTQVVTKYCHDTAEEFNTPDLTRVFITYTSATPEMLEEARKACERMGFKEVIETFAGGTIASHCGPHTLGILYINDGKSVADFN